MRTRRFREPLTTSALSLLLITCSTGLAQPGYISTVAGAVPREGPRLSVSLQQPGTLRFDSAGNLLMMQYDRLSEISVEGRVRTILQAGSNWCFGTTSVVGQDNAMAIRPYSEAISLRDGSYIYATSSCGNYGVRRIYPSGQITTVASLPSSRGVLPATEGSFWVTQPAENVIVLVDSSGKVIRVAGTGSPGFSGDGGPAVAATLNNPSALAADGQGNLLFSDNNNNRIRRISPDGTVRTIAGNGQRGFSADGSKATEAALGFIEQMAVLADGTIVFADSLNHRVRRIRPDGLLETIAGNGLGGLPELGVAATSTAFPYPMGIAIDPRTGDTFFSDRETSQVYRIDGNGIATLFAGISLRAGEGGPAIFSRIGQTWSPVFDPNGNLVFIDRPFRSRIRSVEVSGAIRTLAEFPQTAVSVAVAPDGAIYISDGRTIQQLNPDGTWKVVAGQGTSNSSVDGGLASDAQFKDLQYLKFGPDGVLYASDRGDHRVRAIDATGIIRTIAGNGSAGFSGDGGPASSAQLNGPRGVAFDREEISTSLTTSTSGCGE